jgi:hypothetical protein
MVSQAHDRNLREPCVEILDEAMVQVLRNKTTVERVAMIFDAERTMRLLLQADVAWRHPDWDSHLVTEEVARRFRNGSS